jgi:MFS family permease
MLPLLIFRLTDSVTAVALYATVGALVTGSTGLVVGWLSDRIGRAIPVVASSLTLALGPFGCALFVDNALLLAVSAIFTSLGGQWLASLMPSLVRVSGDGNEQGRLTAVTEAAWTFGNLGGTMAAGILIGLAAPIPFVLAGVLNFGTVLLALQAARILRGTDILSSQ